MDGLPRRCVFNSSGILLYTKFRKKACGSVLCLFLRGGGDGGGKRASLVGCWRIFDNVSVALFKRSRGSGDSNGDELLRLVRIGTVRRGAISGELMRIGCIGTVRRGVIGDELLRLVRIGTVRRCVIIGFTIYVYV